MRPGQLPRPALSPASLPALRENRRNRRTHLDLFSRQRGCPRKLHPAQRGDRRTLRCPGRGGSRIKIWCSQHGPPGSRDGGSGGRLTGFCGHQSTPGRGCCCRGFSAGCSDTAAQWKHKTARFLRFRTHVQHILDRRQSAVTRCSGSKPRQDGRFSRMADRPVHGTTGRGSGRASPGRSCGTDAGRTMDARRGHDRERSGSRQGRETRT